MTSKSVVYLDSVEDSTTMLCFLEGQATALAPRNIMYLSVVCLSSESLHQNMCVSIKFHLLDKALDLSCCTDTVACILISFKVPGLDLSSTAQGCSL